MRPVEGRSVVTQNALKSSEVFRGAAIAFLCPVLVLLAFAGKPFHIDDPLYLWTAQQVHQNPVDFYGFDVNWGKTTQPMYSMNQNPPGVAYYVALIAFFFGWTEIPIHVGMALLAGVASVGTYLLGRAWCARPLVAALIAALSPVFLLSGSTVMSDMAMLACYVWAVLLWVWGLAKGRQGLLFAASVLMGLAALTKYFGLSVVPLLLVYSVVRRRGVGLWILHLAIPLLMVGAFLAHAYRLYGINLLTSAAGIATDPIWRSAGALVSRPFTGLVFMGGCLATALLFAPLLWRRRALGIAACAGLVAALPLAPFQKALAWLSEGPVEITWFYQVQCVVMAIGGIQILALCLTELAERRDAESLLLSLWLVGTLVFAVFINHAVSGRTILPMAPAVGILLARRLGPPAPDAPDARGRRVWLALAPVACLSVWVMIGDYELASASRRAAREFEAAREAYSDPAYFMGHWGFQYYMEEAGARPLEIEYVADEGGYRLGIGPGDTLVVPSNNVATLRLDGDSNTVYRVLRVPIRCGLTTLNASAGAGFYAHQWGMLPFVFASVPPEEFFFYGMGNAALHGPSG